MASGMSSGVLALAFTVMSVGVAAQQPLLRRVFKGRYGSSLEDHARYGQEVSELYTNNVPCNVPPLGSTAGPVCM
jgi:hypothetical protein